ncbi:M1 family metallopeptidase [Alteraurantiacibacter aquimixticola]|uniref:Aminopeptidase N n=1 Tax=Alteraurantiacibacter aquimixticola TaxID=2489173 RepID=A0A4T3F2Y6_9SPHN|nr:M1 family metallopeptidase [Alteraurantiacibacter aquimixticola]TIX49795.1 aminopeptidase [Alteraurantiacibacter aquimixticola]
MRILFSAAAAASLFSLSACEAPFQSEAGERMVAPILTSEEAFDDFTFAQPQVARVTHVALDLALDFEEQDVSGTATLDILAADGAGEIVLDSDGLQVESVATVSGEALDWQMGEHVDGKGEPLTITFGEAAPEQIVVTYTSAPEAEALQWLSPEQTAGGAHPFLFSQGQAILNRTWIPTQDSPGIRQSWEARVTAPEELNVVMSGIIQGEAEEAGEGRHAFAFRMDHPVAPYLIAIAAGDITFRELGPRSGVWAEPAMIEEAAAELVDTEAMIDAAEGLYGDYRWGRYDMIVLPPAFPYGGMENPVMTFLTPTFIAGDRSNTGLVAHELAHSWSGNLVTYSSWRDGWLNEGVTSYIESRISEEVFGTTRSEQEYALSYGALVDMVEDKGADNPVTAMRTPAGTSPFDTAGEAIYDKGTVFLRTVEGIIGRERFDPWLRQWFDAHAFQPATSEMFIADLRENLIQGDEELEEALMLEEWIYGTGIPANAAKPDPAAFAAVDAAVAAYAADGTLDAESWHGWSAAEQMRFLREVPEQLDTAALEELNETLGLSQTGNNEIRFLWLRLALMNDYDPAVPEAEEFLSTVGRNKFVSPLYQVLADRGDWGMAIARPLYTSARPTYHAYTRGSVDEVLDWDES